VECILKERNFFLWVFNKKVVFDKKIALNCAFFFYKEIALNYAGNYGKSDFLSQWNG